MDKQVVPHQRRDISPSPSAPDSALTAQHGRSAKTYPWHEGEPQLRVFIAAPVLPPGFGGEQAAVVQDTPRLVPGQRPKTRQPPQPRDRPVSPTPQSTPQPHMADITSPRQEALKSELRELLTGLLDQFLAQDGASAKFERLAALADWADRYNRTCEDWAAALKPEVEQYVQRLNLTRQCQLLANLLARSGQGLQLRDALKDDLCKPRAPELSVWTAPLTLLGVLRAQLVEAMGETPVTGSAWQALALGLRYRKLCDVARAVRGTNLRSMAQLLDAELIDRLKFFHSKYAAIPLEQYSLEDISKWQRLIGSSGLSDEILASQGLPQAARLAAISKRKQEDLLTQIEQESRWSRMVEGFVRAWIHCLDQIHKTGLDAMPSRLGEIVDEFMQTTSVLMDGDANDWAQSPGDDLHGSSVGETPVQAGWEEFVHHMLKNMGTVVSVERLRLVKVDFQLRGMEETEESRKAMWQMQKLLDFRQKGNE